MRKQVPVVLTAKHTISNLKKGMREGNDIRHVSGQEFILDKGGLIYYHGTIFKEGRGRGLFSARYAEKLTVLLKSFNQRSNHGKIICGGMGSPRE
jgi:hypothetical protein